MDDNDTRFIVLFFFIFLERNEPKAWCLWYFIINLILYKKKKKKKKTSNKYKQGVQHII